MCALKLKYLNIKTQVSNFSYHGSPQNFANPRNLRNSRDCLTHANHITHEI